MQDKAGTRFTRPMTAVPCHVRSSTRGISLRCGWRWAGFALNVVVCCGVVIGQGAKVSAAQNSGDGAASWTSDKAIALAV